jgi:hypothetical protein
MSFSRLHPGSRRRLRHAAVAVVAAGSLVLAACGSDDGGDSDDGAAGTSPNTSASAAASSGAATSDGADSTTAGKSGAADSSTDPSAAPGDNGGSPEGEPGRDGDRPAGDGGAPAPGAPAGDDDAAQITAVARGIADQHNQADYNQYMLDNYCQGYIDGHGGRDALQGEVDRLRTENRDVDAQITVDGVDDIRVDGDSATGVTRGTVNGQPSSSPTNYLREGGAWKICPAA